MARITIQDFYKKKQAGEKIVMITAYDFPFARIVDEAGVHAILVGDSVAMVVQGLENTMPVSMDEMVYHTKMVSRAAEHAMVLGDMPYMSYQTSVRDAVLNASRFIKEAGAQGVKVEGGSEILPQIKAMVQAEIPVMAHIGLTPQSIYRMGGYKIQGKTEKAAAKLMEEAIAVQEAGSFSIVLEAMPANLAAEITTGLDIPTIGIGAGPSCDGQILVLHDVIGLFERFTPRFVKTYVNLKEKVLSAVTAYKDEVENGLFPTESHSFK